MGPQPMSRTPSASSAQTPATTASSPPGSAAICGVALLGNATAHDPERPRALYFDANFFGGTESSTSARLRLWNKDNLSFDSDDNCYYMIYATVAQPLPGSNTYGGDPWYEYDLMGDIHWIHPAPGAEGCILPLMIVAGPASEIKRDEAIYKVSATQYTQMLQGPGSVQVEVKISDSPRYKNGKPIPYSDGSNTSVTGELYAVTRVPLDVAGVDGAEKAELFHLDLMNVVYFPRSNGWQPNTPATPTPNKPVGNRRRAMGAITFDVKANGPKGKGKNKRDREDEEDEDVGGGRAGGPSTTVPVFGAGASGST